MAKNKANDPRKDDEARRVDAELLPDDADIPENLVAVDLTPEEEQDLLNLERKVERAFYEAGKALDEIKRRGLHRKVHPNFETYCQDRFGMTRRHINYLIAGTKVFDNITKGTNCSLVPTNEAQCRPLTKLDPEAQVEAWQEAVRQAGDRVPTAKIVSKVVREKTEIPRYGENPMKVNDIVEIVVKGNPDLRGRGGEWGIIAEVFETSCMVKVWDGTMQIRVENMKDLVLPPEQREAVREICDRCHGLIHVEGLNDTVKAVLATLSKKTWLDEVEESILNHIEEIYGLERGGRSKDER